jgi:hypothetical protein
MMWLTRHGLALLLGISLATCSLFPRASVADDRSHLYATWEGSEPDKGASAWYIKRHIDPKAVFETHPHGSMVDRGTAFDTPFARYRRIHNASTLETLLQEHPSGDPAIRKLARLTHDIEINLWRPKLHPESAVLEARVREIDAGYGGAGVPMDCFIAFFDGVYRWLASTAQEPARLVIPPICRPGSAPAG